MIKLKNCRSTLAENLIKRHRVDYLSQALFLAQVQAAQNDLDHF